MEETNDSRTILLELFDNLDEKYTDRFEVVYYIYVLNPPVFQLYFPETPKLQQKVITAFSASNIRASTNYAYYVLRSFYAIETVREPSIFIRWDDVSLVTRISLLAKKEILSSIIKPLPEDAKYGITSIKNLISWIPKEDEVTDQQISTQ